MGTGAATFSEYEHLTMQEAKIKEFQEYYRDLKTSFMRYACSLLRDQTQAEEVVHEAFLSAYSHWDSFKGQSKRSTWLWSILRNECLQHFRKAEFKYEVLGSDEMHNLASDEDTLDVQLVKNAESIRVEQALDKLSPAQREVLELRLADMALDEIAVVLKIPVATVKSHIHRAKKSLIEKLKEGEDE